MFLGEQPSATQARLTPFEGRVYVDLIPLNSTLSSGSMIQRLVTAIGAPHVAASVYVLIYTGLVLLPIAVYCRSSRSRARHVINGGLGFAFVFALRRPILSCESAAVGAAFDFSSNIITDTPVDADTARIRTLAEIIRYSSKVPPKRLAKFSIPAVERLMLLAITPVVTVVVSKVGDMGRVAVNFCCPE